MRRLVIEGVVLLSLLSHACTEHAGKPQAERDPDNGPRLEWDENGALRRLEMWRDGWRTGFHMVWGPKGNLVTFETLVRHANTGPSMDWHENGALERFAMMVDTQTEGPLIGWHPNGKLAHTSMWVRGLPEGEVRWYYESGALLAVGTRRAGRDHGMTTRYYESGQVWHETSYVEGAPTAETDYFETGEVRSMIEYRDGKSWTRRHRDSPTEPFRDEIVEGNLVPRKS